MPHDLAAQIFTTWERMAPGWERWREPIWDASAHIGRDLVERLDPQPDETILELAAGVGDTGFLVADRVSPRGTVISSDFSPAMVESARRRAAELGVTGIEFRVLDAQNLDLADASIDGVVCRWGYMLMPDPAAALRETRRVLKPGGRLVFSVWGLPDKNPWAAIPARVLVEMGHIEPPRAGGPGIFALADPERIDALMLATGFERPEVAEVRMDWRFDTFEQYWAYVTESFGALSMAVAPLPAAEQERVRGAVREALGSRAGGTFELGGLCLNVATRRADA